MDDDKVTFEVVIEALVIETNGRFSPAIKIGFPKVVGFSPVAADDPLSSYTLVAGRDYDRRESALRFAQGWAKRRISQIDDSINSEIARQCEWMKSKEYKRLLDEMTTALDERNQKLSDAGYYPVPPMHIQSIMFDRLQLWNPPPFSQPDSFDIYAVRRDDDAGFTAPLPDDDDESNSENKKRPE